MEAQHDLASGRLRRRPLPIYNHSYNENHQIDVSSSSLESPSPALSPRPPYLRPSRSATNLSKASHHPDLRPDRLSPRAIDTSKSLLPVGFISEDVPSPASSLAPDPDQALRRAKSSSALYISGEDPTQSATSPAQQSSPSSSASMWKSALGEAQYFAGGLISRPAESTRHYSIIRHSHALIWYRGPSTSVSITILSDDPLPATRSIWLQQKGFSGNMGMTLKALTGTTGSWLDVTPVRRAGPENIPEADERGIQRDLKRFAKKASGRQKKHMPRETHMVRIPAAATDGYFRLVLCTGEQGKKVLCGSPVFRVASTSTDSGVVRGASLSTMPLEVGVKVASTIGQTVAKKYTGVAGAVVQSKATKFAKHAAVKKVGHVANQGYQAYQTTGLSDAVNESWRRNKDGRYDSLVAGTMMDAPVRVIGSDAGPEPPFPVKFDGKVVMGTGKSAAEMGIPTANLSGVSETIKVRMGGVFAAWACVQPTKNAGQDDISLDWHEAIVSIAPLRNAPPTVAMKNSVIVHMIHDFEDVQFFEARVKVLLMGYLHPAASPSTESEELVEQHAQDVMTTLASLARVAWAPHDTVDKIRSLKSERSFSERLDEATGKVQQQVDRIPLHWAGVRSESGTMQDKVYGNGGLWIQR